MIDNLHKYVVKKWITIRMAAMEFYFKQPFEIKNEYPIMKSILFFAMAPIEMVFIFTYARLFGSLSAYTLQILIVLTIINLIISNILINRIKEDPVIDDTIMSYHHLDYESRRKLYSFKDGFIVTFLMAFLPWIIFFACIAIVCHLIPLKS